MERAILRSEDAVAVTDDGHRTVKNNSLELFSVTTTMSLVDALEK